MEKRKPYKMLVKVICKLIHCCVHPSWAIRGNLYFYRPHEFACTKKDYRPFRMDKKGEKIYRKRKIMILTRYRVSILTYAKNAFDLLKTRFAVLQLDQQCFFFKGDLILPRTCSIRVHL